MSGKKKSRGNFKYYDSFDSIMKNDSEEVFDEHIEFDPLGKAEYINTNFIENKYSFNDKTYLETELYNVDNFFHEVDRYTYVDIHGAYIDSGTSDSLSEAEILFQAQGIPEETMSLTGRHVKVKSQVATESISDKDEPIPVTEKAKMKASASVRHAKKQDVPRKPSSILRDRQKIRKEVKISKPPGSMFMSVTSFLFSSKTVGLVFEPAVNDMRNEYYESMLEGDKIKANWILIKYRIAFVNVFISRLSTSAVKKIIDLMKAA